MSDHGGKADLFRSELTGEWYLRLKGANGETLATTEGHKNRVDVTDVWYTYFSWFRLYEDGEPVGEVEQI